VDEAELAALDYCYITTTGRTSGRPHTIEIWFAVDGDRAYVLSGGGEGSDWVKNLLAHPTVGLRIGDRDMLARAHVIEDPVEDASARRVLLEKYSPKYEGDLDEWGRSGLPVAIELPPGESYPTGVTKTRED
jgi:deazaflavin-dependent oxidoreductase (nitroreductase family)